jgi:hypothetical protein
MEIIAEKDTAIRVYGKDCIGCKNNKAHIMISFTEKGKEGINDLFLNKEQAYMLAKELIQRLEKKN